MKYIHVTLKKNGWRVPDIEYIVDTGLRYDIGVLDEDDYTYCILTGHRDNVVPVDDVLCNVMQRAALWGQLISYGLEEIECIEIGVDDILDNIVNHIIILYRYTESTAWGYLPTEMRKIKRIFH